MIVSAFLGWLVWSGILGGFLAPQIHSIAVLPFLPLDGNAAHNYLGLGMAEAVVTRLTAIPRITVRPTSAVVKYLQPDRDPLVALGCPWGGLWSPIPVFLPGRDHP